MYLVSSSLLILIKYLHKYFKGQRAKSKDNYFLFKEEEDSFSVNCSVSSNGDMAKE